jgi:ABC-type Fe3+ transport system substrate-binding protein
MSRFATKAAFAAAALIVSAAPVFAQSALTPAVKELAQLAAQDKEMTVTWSNSTMGGQKGAKAFETGINKMFGINIKISWAPGDSMPNVGNQVATTAQNGLPSPTDVYMGFSRNMAVLKDRNLFHSAPWASYFPDRLTNEIVEEDTYVKVVSATLGFTYNSALAPSKPEKLEDFLKPEWKGKYGTTAFGAGFDQIAAKEAWGPEKTIEFAKKFSEGAAGFLRCNEMGRLSSGEFLALVTDCSGDSAREFAATKGAPLARVVAPDVPLVSYFYFAVPKNAKASNLGKLFVAFALTKEGQSVIREQTFGDLHLLPESIVKDEVAKAEKIVGKKFASGDIAWQKTNDAGNAAQQEVAKILAAGGKK